MKYKHTGKIKINRHRKLPKCGQFLIAVQKQVIDKVFPTKDGKGDALTPYIIGGFNLLKNEGSIKNDREAHTDYADRLPQ